MIVYDGDKNTFQKDIMNGKIARKIDELFREFGIPKEQYSEFVSWQNSLPRMAAILSDRRIDDKVQVAIEYQIPLTSKRVDFMVGGSNGNDDNVVIIELKQWTTCIATSREHIVNAFTGNANRDVQHPSKQAYNYANLISNLNEAIYKNNIKMIPCAYLHNYKEENREQICHKVYKELIDSAPIFLENDGEKLQEFLVQYVSRPSNKKLFELIEHGKLKPSKSLQDAVGSILNGNREFNMIDEQDVAFATILKIVQDSLKTNKKKTVIVQGGPGTGKSVIAINLLARILSEGFSCSYISKNGAPRYTFSKSFVKGKYKLSYLKGLFKGSGGFYNVPQDSFDCLLVDEAHRLNEKSGMFSNLGENQIKEIINASKVSVFFIDEDQVVTTKDIGSIEEIKKWANVLGSEVYDKDMKLVSQFRCNGNDGYLAFLDSVLQKKNSNSIFMFDLDYDIQIFDSPTLMKEALRKKNEQNKSRMIAGYCYPWNSEKDKTKMDIILEDNFVAQWNFTTNEFATDPNSFEQVGCIHSTQGLEFDYVGIIIGKDLRYENGKVITDYTKRAKSDASIKGIKTSKNYELADRIIRNTYKTLLSRGMNGCYVYCEDKALSDYLKRMLAIAKKMKLRIN